jgi:hypothetical protein
MVVILSLCLFFHEREERTSGRLSARRGRMPSRLYVFGWNDCGQLGLGDSVTRSTPQPNASVSSEVGPLFRSSLAPSLLSSFSVTPSAGNSLLRV